MKHFLYLLVLLVFCSCNSEKNENKAAVISTPTGLNGLQKGNPTVATSAQNASAALIFNPKHGQPGHTCALAEGAPFNPKAAVQPQRQQITQPQSTDDNISANVNTPGKNLNPKHGDPGHRCDIAVGAPLDSKPVQVAQTQQSQPVVTQTVNTKVAKGMNPPHGQAGHRCDIAVGAPLNSKPVQAATVTTIPAANNVPAEVRTTDALSGAKLNPKHGDPGHRCDIAVGAPLS